jgi:hypothetical protein
MFTVLVPRIYNKNDRTFSDEGDKYKMLLSGFTTYLVGPGPLILRRRMRIGLDGAPCTVLILVDRQERLFQP